MKSNFNFEERSLLDVPLGEEAIVATVDTSDPIGRRLITLGLRPNTLVRVLRHAPLGDPTLYELRGYRLCLRRSEASRIRVRKSIPAA